MLHLAPLYCLLGVISRVSACQHCGYVQLRDGRARLWCDLSSPACATVLQYQPEMTSSKRRQDSYLKTKHVEQYAGTGVSAGLRVCVGMSTSVRAYRRYSTWPASMDFFFVCLSNTHHCNHKQHIKATIQEINPCGLQHWQPVSSQLFSERLFFFVFFPKDPAVCSERKQKEGTDWENCFPVLFECLCCLSFVPHRSDSFRKKFFHVSNLILDERSALCEVSLNNRKKLLQNLK